MIDLKLAEYDLKTGKFKKFLEIGKGFYYAKDYIVVDREGFVLNSDSDCVYYYLDKIDLLRRFGSAFNGKTYGLGRFVLIVNNNKAVIAAIKSTIK
jgi:hypothetical protein